MAKRGEDSDDEAWPERSREGDPPRWHWAVLALAMAWAACIRIPIILNAGVHLDSDLAVDGLTLLDALRGHWRWHYPGTPYMGTIPVGLSYLQAMLWGANPRTLVSGGLVAYELVILSTYLLARKVVGPRAALLALLSLAFSSTGTLWLSGRITGGHLLTVAWHAAAFLGLYQCLSRGSVARSVMLGLWCGLGLYLDRMFLMSLLPLAWVGFVGGVVGRSGWRGLVQGMTFVFGLLIGFLPHTVGLRVDPHDAYSEQFDPILKREVLVEHARILALDCLPRLIAGHRLPNMESEPSPESLAGRPAPRRPQAAGVVAVATVVLGLGLIPIALVGWGWMIRAPGEDSESIARRCVAFGLLLSCVGVTLGFVVNRNIFNSDNYRYLVFYLVPLALGTGKALERLSRRGGGSRIAAYGFVGIFAITFAADSLAWYRRFGWVDESGLPRRVEANDSALRWVEDHPEITEVFGGYWDVYRLSFLTTGRVKGVPFPVFPDRFPEWSSRMPGHRPRLLLARATPEGAFYRATALREGGKVVHQGPGFVVIDWP